MTTTTLAHCSNNGCKGLVDEGYCDVCGLPPNPPPSQVSAPWRRGWHGNGRAVRIHASVPAPAMPHVPRRDPANGVMVDPQVPEGKRFCSRCDVPVGRGTPDRPGRTEGFCPRCGLGYSFTSKLRPGDVVAGQYEVLGCLAHGGLGWIYLARDRQVGDRPVVLKGLLDSADTDAMAAAVAERRFLAAVQHPSIVEIHNFVEHCGAGYIVMEYVDGRSLKSLLLERRETTGESLPLPEVLAYGLEALDALGHLHDLGLLYCDFKPDNALHAGARLKLIDLGGVRHARDEQSPIYGTTGYQAPEIAESGPSIGSDLYTVARTMAVLSFEFHGYTGRYRYALPDRDTVPLLARYESFDRLLRRATHADRRERFASADEMAEQLSGVLREVLAAEDGRARPARSAHFEKEATPAGTRGGVRPSPAEMAAALPLPRSEGTDPAVVRRLHDHVERGEFARAGRLPPDGCTDWRVTWYAGVAALAGHEPDEAARGFTRVYDRFPGEAAPQLALAFCAELTGDLETARRYHRRVWRTQRAHISAVFGLARVSVARGDRSTAVAALASVPTTSVFHADAQVGAVLAELRGREPDDLGLAELLTAAGRVEALDLANRRRARLAALVLEAALGQVLAGRPVALGPGAGERLAADALLSDGVEALGPALDEHDLRLALERTYRDLARAVDDRAERLGLIDRANAVRPRTLT